MTPYSWTKRMEPVAGPAGWQDDEYYCWGGTAVVGPGELGAETVHFIGARWPRWSGYLGWLTRSEVCRAISGSLTGPFLTQEQVLGPRKTTRPDGAYYWDQHNAHNPTLLRVGDTLCLFYTGTQHDPASPLEDRETPQVSAEMPNFYEAGPYGWPRMHQRVGVALADSPRGPWRRLDEPLLEPDEEWAPFFTTNPSACLGPDGRIYLYYKSIDPIHKRMKLGVAIAECPEGPYFKYPGNPIIDPGPQHHVEDHHVWLQDGIFHMIVKDMTGGLCGTPLVTVQLTSKDGLEWDLSQARIIFTPGWPLAGGGFRETHRMEQCNVLLDNGQPAVLYASFQDGDERLCPYHPSHGEYLKTHAPGEVRTGNIALRLR